MTATRTGWPGLKPGIYWSEQGEMGCEWHTAYVGTDTWVFGHWQA